MMSRYPISPRALPNAGAAPDDASQSPENLTAAAAGAFETAIALCTQLLASGQISSEDIDIPLLRATFEAIQAGKAINPKSFLMLGKIQQIAEILKCQPSLGHKISRSLLTSFESAYKDLESSIEALSERYSLRSILEEPQAQVAFEKAVAFLPAFLIRI